jgi:putative SOS response-associated peptidase YedK
MCGRYSITTAPEALRRLFKFAGATPNLPPRYNVAPTQDAPVVRLNKARDGRELAMLRWGLVPYWSKDPKSGAKMINARAETVATKPAFREAFAKRRCLVPADGFFEWKKLATRKQPYYITQKNGEPFAFAGLWEYWRSPAGERLQTFTVIVGEPNAAVAPIHDRMPVILDARGADLWLDPAAEPEQLQALLKPAPAENVQLTPVSTRVNDPDNDDADCVTPIDEAAARAEAPTPAPRPKKLAKARAKPGDDKQLKLLD